MGPALEPFRKDVFLACKTKMRDAKGAKMEFERSLERLKTDHFDLYQLHVLSDPKKDVDGAFAKGGAMEYIAEQKKAGRIRYIGFSAHTEEAALAAMDAFDFDSCMAPIGFSSWFKGDFGPKTIAKAVATDTTVISIKGFCRGRWEGNDPLRKRYKFWYKPTSDRAEAEMALRFVMSQKKLMAAIPPANVEIHNLAMDVASSVKPITPDETAKLKAIAEGVKPLFPR
jgi:predicted aldo/keto reductase-like oxidoreductase